MSRIEQARRFTIALLCSMATAALAAPAAQAAFGIVPGSLDGSILDREGNVYTQAGRHPWKATVSFELNTELNEKGRPISSEADVRSVFTEIPAGFVGNPQATPRCDREEFFATGGVCPASTQVGIADARVSREGGEVFRAPVYNLIPAHGAPAEFGFSPGGVITVARPVLRSDGDYGVTAHVIDVPQIASLLSATFTLWGLPAHPDLDPVRGDFGGFGDTCGIDEEGNRIPGPPCSSDAPLIPFWTMPTDCSHGPFETAVRVVSWQGHEDSATFTSHDGAGNEIGVTGCEAVPFEPSIEARPTSRVAESAAGLDFDLEMPTAGILDPEGTAQAHIKEAAVTLPEGVTVNPSSAEGLGVCTEAQLARETATSAPGAGCPNASKVGDIEVKSPLIEETLRGSLHVAEPFANPFDTLIALYIVARSPERGLIVKLAGKVEPDPATGQLVTTFGDGSADPPFDALPPLPFSSFELRFREGARAPLVTPPTCGDYEIEAEFTPYSAQDPDNPEDHEIVESTSTFEIDSGPNGGPCPSGGVQPFAPGFAAGTLNNAAGSHSPFLMRLTRRDGDQDLTRFDADLPPGLVAKLAGVSECPEASIAIARAKSGRAEQASPSCPASSQIGRVMAGAGVGSVLTYVPGRVYLAGPFAGAPLSVVGIVPAVAGPFDVGTVVTRQALVLNPVTAAVRVDGALSEPIPHILAGIPLRVRDIQVTVDRPSFTLNPTNCDPMAVGASIWGGGADVFSRLDDAPVFRAQRFQAAGCARLPFKPRLGFRLFGGTHRGAHPALRAVVAAKSGHANIRRAVVKLPRSAFLEQGHIRTVCTRAQFAQNACPKGSIYGRARAFSPLLDEPLEGPVYLRSSDDLLPNLVIALRGKVDVNLVGRIDSVRGGIRTTFATVPDAPVSRFVLRMQGGKKGLIVNSRNLCARPSRAMARFRGQNGKLRAMRPRMRPVRCKKRKGRRAELSRARKVR